MPSVPTSVIPIDHMAADWKVGPAKMIDLPIETVDAYGSRIVVARCPFGKKVDAEAIAKLVSASPDMAKALAGFVRNKDMIKTEEPFNRALAGLMDMAEAALEKGGVKL